MKTQINKELAALMQLDSAEQAIKTLLSSGVAPGTVAAQKVQETAALTQAAPQSQAAPPGIEALLPGVQQQAAQAAQAAQPATQGDVNQLRQMMAQAQQGQGVAQLPGSDVEMAEGGIVGYNGEGPSFVERLPEESGLRKMLEWLASGRPRLEKPLLSELTKRYEETPPPAAAPSAPRPMSEAEIARLQEANVALSGAPIAPPTPRPPAPERTAQRKPAAEVTKPAETGLPALMGPPVPSGSERQFGEALSVAGRVDPGKARTPEQIRAEIEAVYRARGIEPGKAEQERIAKLEAFDAQEEAERKKRVEQRGMQDLITFLTGFGGASSMVEGGRRGTAASTQLQQGWERSDEAYNLLKRQRMDAIAAERVALANRNQALADGDIATAAREAEALRTAQNARLATEAKMRADFAVPMMQAETAAANRASTEMIHDKDRASRERLEGARLAQQAELNGQTRLANQINAANITVSSAIEKMDRDLDKRFGQSVKLFQLMSPEDIQKNPGLAASYQQYIRERESIYKTSVEPAINHRNRLAAQISGGGSNVQRYDSQGNPIK